jgi:hypothetical protein
MSNLYHPLKTVEVRDSIVDFVEPAYIVRKPANLKSFQINQTQTYSNSAITTKLEVSNTQMVIDRNILWEQPIDVSITGSLSTGGQLINDGAFSLRSNALAKIVNTINVQYGNVSYAFNSSDVVSALERYNSYDCTKYNTSLSASYLDQSQSYDDFIGSNRNPMNLFSVGTGSQFHRGAFPVRELSNPVLAPNVVGTATFKTTLRAMLLTSPLLDQILKHGTGYGLTHLNNLNIDLTLIPALGSRLFSVAKNIGANVLSVNSLTVQIQQPIFRFIQVSPHFDEIPPVLTYGLNTLERYPTDFVFQNQIQQVPSQVIQLSRIPQYLMFFARYNNNITQQGNGAGIAGCQIPDAFASLVSATVDFDGETLLSNADNAMFYKMSSENQLVDNFLTFNGEPLVKSFNVGTTGQYVFPAGSVCKLVFNKDISLKKASLASGVNYRTNIQVNATFKNQTYGTASNISNNFTFYLIAVYDDILQLYGDNNGQIGYAPLSESDVLNSNKQNENIHYDIMRNHNLTGAGLLSGLSNILSHGKKLYPMIHKVYGSNKYLRGKIKEFLRNSGDEGKQLANNLSSMGFGAQSGGAMAGRNRLRKNLLN